MKIGHLAILALLGYAYYRRKTVHEVKAATDMVAAGSAVADYAAPIVHRFTGAGNPFEGLYRGISMVGDDWDEDNPSATVDPYSAESP